MTDAAVEVILGMFETQHQEFIKDIEDMKYDKKSPSVFDTAYNLAIENILTRLGETAEKKEKRQTDKMTQAFTDIMEKELGVKFVDVETTE